MNSELKIERHLDASLCASSAYMDTFINCETINLNEDQNLALTCDETKNYSNLTVEIDLENDACNEEKKCLLLHQNKAKNQFESNNKKKLDNDYFDNNLKEKTLNIEKINLLSSYIAKNHNQYLNKHLTVEEQNLKLTNKKNQKLNSVNCFNENTQLQPNQPNQIKQCNDFTNPNFITNCSSELIFRNIHVSILTKNLVSKPVIKNKKEKNFLCDVHNKNKNKTKNWFNRFYSNLPGFKSELFQMQKIDACLKQNTSYKEVNQREILSNVSGYAKAGQLLAIMGPSGSGKTTLLNVLSGRLHPDKGSVTINGKQLNKQLKRKIAYVLQNDIFFAGLTLKQTLIYTALLRMPESMSRVMKIQHVQNIIDLLDLKNCQDTIIGDIINRGLSGGEKKRASIACELLSNPSIMLLDEPTSGLDSCTAFNLMKTLKEYAVRECKTLIASIHQPSSQMFHMFDKLLLLTNGQLAFFGKTTYVVPFFQNLGFSITPHYNPADFVIEKIKQKQDLEKIIIAAKHLIKQYPLLNHNNRHYHRINNVSNDLLQNDWNLIGLGKLLTNPTHNINIRNVENNNNNNNNNDQSNNNNNNENNNNENNNINNLNISIKNKNNINLNNNNNNNLNKINSNNVNQNLRSDADKKFNYDYYFDQHNSDQSILVTDCNLLVENSLFSSQNLSNNKCLTSIKPAILKSISNEDYKNNHLKHSQRQTSNVGHHHHHHHHHHQNYNHSCIINLPKQSNNNLNEKKILDIEANKNDSDFCCKRNCKFSFKIVNDDDSGQCSWTDTDRSSMATFSTNNSCSSSTCSTENVYEDLIFEIDKPNLLNLNNQTCNEYICWQTSFLTQINVLMRRNFYETRYRLLSKMNWIQAISLGLISGLLWFQLKRQESTLNDIRGFMYFSNSYWMLFAWFAVLTTIQPELEIMNKERLSGAYRLSAFYLAKMISELPLIITLPSIYFFICYPMFAVNLNLITFLLQWLFMILSALAAQSIGLFVGLTAMNLEVSVTISALYSTLISLFGGFYTTSLPTWLSWIRFTSIMHYSFQNMQIIELTFGEPIRCSSINSRFDYCLKYFLKKDSNATNLKSNLTSNSSLIQNHSIDNLIQMQTTKVNIPYEELISELSGEKHPCFWTNTAILIFFLILFRLFGYLVLRFVHKPK